MEYRQQENFKELNEMLQKVQCTLQDVASCVATPLTSASEKQIARTEFDKDLVVEMEEWIDKFTKDLPELKNFILLSGGRGSCSLHVTRSICRRAERKVASRFIQNDVDEPVAKYINRLSDFLFTLARYVASMEGHPEVIYKKPRRKNKLVDAKLTTTDSDNDKETKD
ncbi:unnamed protein product [Clavelina lepadiformis]|uniref:Cobalamin adenosyltransferase-like domain-containing protein n=1 Tax=Clavelina lepadiformis TaxID=159417 RepID=A0ABP0FT83_CLALP